MRLRSGAGVALVTGTVLASLVALFDSVAVNITVPAIGRDLAADVSGVQWVVTGYLLTVASLLLLTGVLIDHFGPRRVLVAGLVVLLAASMLCAVARITGELIAARLLQGAGAALVVPSSVALLNGTLRVADRARGLGVWAGLSTLGLTVGPYVGGWLADHASWRYVFLFNLPVVLPTLWVLRHVPAAGSSGGRLTLDVPGVMLTVGGLSGITYALTAAPAAGWLSAPVLAPGVLGLGCLAALVPVERRGHSPMLHLSLFRSRQFDAVNVTTIVLFGALAAAAYLLGLQCQLRLGYSAAAAGAVLIPVSAVFLGLSPVVGGLVARFGPRRPVLAGLLAITAALFWLSRVAPGDGYAEAILPGALLWGLGLGLTVAPLTAAVLAAVSDDQLGQASAINNAAAQIGVLLLVTLVPALIGVGADDLGQALASGYQPAMWVMGGLVVAAAVVTGLFFSDRATDAPRMPPQPQIHSCVLPVGARTTSIGP